MDIEPVFVVRDKGGHYDEDLGRYVGDQPVRVELNRHGDGIVIKQSTSWVRISRDMALGLQDAIDEALEKL